MLFRPFLFRPQDGMHQPYDDILPYHEFSIRLPQKDIDKLDKILQSVSPEEVRGPPL